MYIYIYIYLDYVYNANVMNIYNRYDTFHDY